MNHFFSRVFHDVNNFFCILVAILYSGCRMILTDRVGAVPDNRAAAETFFDSHGPLEKGQRQLQEIG